LEILGKEGFAMRIAIAGFMHESNTFSSTRTDREAFESASLKFGDAVIAEWKDAHHEMGGFIEGASRFGYELVPTVMAWATPAGPVTDDVLDEVVGHIIQSIRPRIRRDGGRGDIDGLLLALHGAMVCEGFPDGDGEALRRLREAFGPRFPIVVTLDFHANLSEQMVRNSTAIVFYQTNPHVDQRQRGLHAASIMARTVRGEVRPTQAFAKPDTLIVIACQNTSLEPLKPFMDAARELEQQPGVLSANVQAGFPYADVHEMGPGVLVVTDNDPARAQREADRLAAELFAARHRLVKQLPDAASAVAQAMRSAKPPVVLVEFGDNIGGGSPGDSTFILAELLRQGARGAVEVIYDPDAVAQAVAAGIGSTVELLVGGKSDRMHGDPVHVSGRVASIHDGSWIEEQPRHGGRRHNVQGKTVVIAVCGLRIAEQQKSTDTLSSMSNQQSAISNSFTLVLNSKRTPPFSLGQLTSVGIDPIRQNIIVVKAAIAYRAAYGPIAGEIIEVDTPGLTANDPGRFRYTQVRRPIFPLDAI
jgi:microcystin degradation protein MlrC